MVAAVPADEAHTRAIFVREESPAVHLLLVDPPISVEGFTDERRGHRRVLGEHEAVIVPGVGTAGGSLADGGRSQEPTALVEHGLFDHLTRLVEQRLRNRQAQEPCSLEVDDELELRGLFDGELSRFGAL